MWWNELVDNPGPFSASDLPIFDGEVYHLNLTPNELAPDIIIVGDPNRVTEIAHEFLDWPHYSAYRHNRGLRTITGTVKDTGQNVSLVTSGMGTSSLEIVLGELEVLNEIDFQTRTRRAQFETINIIRVGTSGALQRDTKLGTPLIADYLIGLDNTGLFYDVPAPEGASQLEDRLKQVIDGATPLDRRFRGKIFPYVARADERITALMEEAAKELRIEYKKGMTVSNSGFFANQGRAISRVRPTVPDIDLVLANFDTGIEGIRIENMEMEGSFLAHFMAGLGYRAGIICPGIANRGEETFDRDYHRNVRDATAIALRAISQMRKINGYTTKTPQQSL